MRKYVLKINNSKFVIRNLNAGMTYVELIVVLSIFVIMSSVVIYNYGDFQDKVDIKNLSSDIALKVVEAQKSAVSGLLPSIGTLPNWKPAYGVYFNTNSSSNTSFIYFTDIDQNGSFTNPPTCLSGGECVQQFTITKGAKISALNVFYSGDTNAHALTELNLVFTRPNSGPKIQSTPAISGTVNYVQVTVQSAKLFNVNIKIYPSGRIQVN